LAASQEPAEPYVATKFKFFRRRSEQLIGREARGELEEAALTVTKHQMSRLTVVVLLCRPPPIKVSLIKFPSSLWSRRSKPHEKLTTMARENLNSSEPPCSAMAHRREREPAAAVSWSHGESLDPVANGRD
jgi:hypothetical protein